MLKKIKDLKVTKESVFWKRWAMEAVNREFNKQKSFTMFMPLKVKELLWGFTSPFIEKLESFIPDIAKRLIPDLNVNPFIQLQVITPIFLDAFSYLIIFTSSTHFCDKFKEYSRNQITVQSSTPLYHKV